MGSFHPFTEQGQASPSFSLSFSLTLSLRVQFLIYIIWLGIFFFSWNASMNMNYKCTSLQIRVCIHMMLRISNFSYICHRFILFQALLFIPMVIFQIRTVKVFVTFLSLKNNLVVFQELRLGMQLSLLKVPTAHLNRLIRNFSHGYSLSDMSLASVTKPWGNRSYVALM